MKNWIFIIGVLFIGIVGASAAYNSSSDKVLKRVTQTEFKEKMKSLKKYNLIDVRTKNEYDRGTIEGAINIDYLGPNFKEELNKLDKETPVLMFCQSGGRSAKALRIFGDLGFSYVLELAGGYGSWTK